MSADDTPIKCSHRVPFQSRCLVRLGSEASEPRRAPELSIVTMIVYKSSLLTCRHVAQEVERVGWKLEGLLVRSPFPPPGGVSRGHLTLTAPDELAVALWG